MFRLAHLSDPHLTPPQFASGWRDLVSKRLLSRLAWRRKRHRHRPEALAALTADLIAQGPDHIVITGDLTNFSTPEEFAAARDWMQGLGPVRDVTVSPGNHDALVRGGSSDPFAAWRDWLGDDPGQDFPNQRVRGEVALINLCSATPTALHLAQGRLGEAQIERLAAALRALKGLCRVVLIHHPLTPGLVGARKSLTDAAGLRAVLAREGAELVLHGHAHRALLTHTPGPSGGIPVMGVSSASVALGHRAPARWHSLEIEREGAGFAVRVAARGLRPDGTVGELGRYRLADLSI
jgi:3',5'-cyclic AMP phosphodiesterase CpdA